MESLKAIKQVLTNKITVLTGHSGVGKSTLLNAIDDNLDLKTGVISDYSQKGMHTTTFATMFDLSFGGLSLIHQALKNLACST